MIDFDLTEEQSLIRDTARRILDRECPREVLRRLDAGYTMELDVQRYVRDSLLSSIGGGTTQIPRDVIAKHLGLRGG